MPLCGLCARKVSRLQASASKSVDLGGECRFNLFFIESEDVGPCIPYRGGEAVRDDEFNDGSPVRCNGGFPGELDQRCILRFFADELMEDLEVTTFIDVFPRAVETNE